LGKLAIIIGIFDFSPGRALHLHHVLKSLNFQSIILTNRGIYIEQLPKPSTDIVTINLRWINYNNVLGRLLFYVFFAFLCFLKMFKYISTSREEQIFIIARHPYPFSILSSLMVKWMNIRKNKRIKIIADVTDLWPESLFFMSEHFNVRIFVKIGMAVNRWVYPKVDVIITHNYPFKKYIERVYLSGRTSTPIVIIPHLIDLSEFRPMNKDEALSMLEKMCCIVPELKEKLRNRIVLGYVGLISETIGSDILLRLFEELKDDEKFVFFVVGEGPLKQEMIHIVKSRNMNNVIFAGPYPHSLMKYVINVFDIALITSFQDPQHFATRYWFPKKFVEYSACGKPIIYIGPSKVLTHYIERYNSGCVIESIDHTSIRDTIYDVLKNIHEFAKNSRKMANCFSLNVAKEEVAKLLYLIKC
jgi:glycosyltransferase involved in cell wall biosynthesis